MIQVEKDLPKYTPVRLEKDLTAIEYGGAHHHRDIAVFTFGDEVIPEFILDNERNFRFYNIVEFPCI
jgi:hypothetical protein